jgi:hypothetical protein
MLVAIIGSYIMLVEVAKGWFYRRYGHRLEQVLIPYRMGGFYLSRMVRLVQDTVATIYLRIEDEIPIDSLVADLKEMVAYPVSLEEIYYSIRYLSKAGIIVVDWRRGFIKRGGALKDYIERYVFSEFWPRIAKDWQSISTYIQAKYGGVNPEYKNLVSRLRL